MHVLLFNIGFITSMVLTINWKKKNTLDFDILFRYNAILSVLSSKWKCKIDFYVEQLSWRSPVFGRCRCVSLHIVLFFLMIQNAYLHYHLCCSCAGVSAGHLNATRVLQQRCVGKEEREKRRWRQTEEQHEEYSRQLGWQTGRASRLASLVWGRLEAEGSSEAEDRMEEKKQFLCGVVEGKMRRVKWVRWRPTS